MNKAMVELVDVIVADLHDTLEMCRREGGTRYVDFEIDNTVAEGVICDAIIDLVGQQETFVEDLLDSLINKEV